MSNPNEHIEDFLKYYFKLKNSPHYAVLLKGNWGVGKNWLLKDVMKQLDSPDDHTKKYLYVSLYGVESFKDIENEFFRELYPLLSSKGVALTGKITKSIVEIFNFKVPEIDIPDYLTKTEGLILVFDDLERASMDIEALLGYINYYVEHQGYKVIIIANENELSGTEGDNASNDNKLTEANLRYRRIKEKLIGKTFEVQPQLDLAIDSFIEEIDNATTHDFFKSSLDLIKDYYRRSGYWNLRHLRQALMDFARLMEFIPSDIREKEDVIEELWSIYLMISFEVKSGEMSPFDINKLKDLYFIELAYKSSSKDVVEGELDDFYVKMREKYPAFDPLDMLLENSVWIEVFNKGLIDKERIEKSLKNSRFFYSDNQPEWIQLWRFMSLRDSDFDSLIAMVKEQFRSKEYEELGEIKHVTGLFLELVERGLLDMTKEDVFEIAKSNIDNLIIQGKEIPHFDYVEIEDDTQTFGLEFRNKNDSKFIKLLEYMTEVSKKQVSENLPEIANELLEDIKNDADSFHKKIYYTGSATIYQKEPVLKYIAPNNFVIAFIEIEPYARRSIALVISSRYKKTPSIEVFLPELDWLREVVSLLKIEVESREGKVSAVQIRYLMDEYLTPAITTLDEASKRDTD